MVGLGMMASRLAAQELTWNVLDAKLRVGVA